MHLSRLGQDLWQEWDGEAYEPQEPSDIVYFTPEHVDVQHDMVRRGLASALQRAGIADGLGDAYRVLAYSNTVQGYAGNIDGEDALTVCTEFGETYYGDDVQDIIPMTWVEVSSNG